MSTELCSPNVLMLIEQGVDAVVLELLDDTIGDIEVSLVVLTANGFDTGPVDTYYNRVEK